MSVRPRTARGGGRHFLRSSRLARQLVASAGISRDDVVVDVGAGAGALTAALADAAARVIAIEVDAELVVELRRRFAARANVDVVQADARRARWPREPFKVVANLPFAGADEILRSLLEPRVPLVAADVIVQWESARKRAAVWPSTLQGVYWGAWHELAVVRRLPPSVFAPPPSVESAVLRVRRRGEPLVPVSESREYRDLLRRGYASGRTVRSVVGPRTFDALAAELGLARDARARDLDAAQWSAVHTSVRRGR